jgi:hypothetical protein
MSPRDSQRLITGGDTSHTAAAWRTEVICSGRLTTRTLAAFSPLTRAVIPPNHAQTARNLRRSLPNAAAGARLIQAERLDGKSAAQLVASLADSLEELQRLQPNLDRRIERENGRREGEDPPVAESLQPNLDRHT